MSNWLKAFRQHLKQTASRTIMALHDRMVIHRHRTAQQTAPDGVTEPA